ncbi:ComEC/Rec2 family competence protein [Blastococcus sp. Marseille-P5729]|uniref:ComEC/Rec2 family competence protein n=1 Tax=Blastococcus sp. Marseille-P5729 TaxID=2086582 RepID=UPI000D0F8370|nr:ComEC/Rec2 family competence protein [Blastococcus sp. Marseille-P5729]
MKHWREHDARLVPGAALVWIGVASGELGWSAGLWWAMVAMAATGLIGAFAGWRSVVHRSRCWLVAFSCMAGIAAALLSSARLQDRLDSVVAHAAREDAFVRLEGTVESRPRQVGGTPDRVVVQVAVSRIEHRGRVHEADQSVVVLGTSDVWAGTLPGATAYIVGTAHPPDRASSVVAFVVASDGSVVDPEAPRWSVVAEAIRDGLHEAASVNDPDAAGLLVALVDGDTSGIGPIVQEEFRLSGLAHLLAVSGANVAIVVGAVLWLTRLCRAPFVLQIGCAAGALLAFVVVAGPEPSVLRAAGMGVVMLVGLASGRPRAAVPALATAIVVLLTCVPALSISVGFLLSVLATAGIVVVGAEWTRRWSERMPMMLAAPLAVAASAGLATLPVIVLLLPMVNLGSLVANIVAAPAVPVATICGVCAAVLAPIAMPLAQLLCVVGGYFTRWIAHVAHVAAEPGPAQIPMPPGVGAFFIVVGVLLVAALAWWLTRRRPLARTSLAAAAVGVLVLATPVRCAVDRWQSPNWVIAACDVGQGDAVLARAGPDAAVLLDAGPDPALLDRCLRELGVERLPLVLLTHFHDDHVAGVPAVLGRRDVERVVIGSYDGGAVEQSIRSIALDQSIPVDEVGTGQRYSAGDVVLEVLGPTRPILGTTSDPNNNSLIVRIDVGGLRLLVTGDAQVELMASMAGCGCLQADVLKVPHHGSKNRDDSFLAATGASLALISVGADNDYGHPAPSTISELERLGMTVRRTDRDGMILVSAADEGVVVTHDRSS